MNDQLRKVAIVTGASSGIGRAVSLALAERGAALTLVGRRKNLLDDVAQQVTAVGGKAIVLPVDLRQAEQIPGLFQATRDQWGRLDVLVNAAGVGIESSVHDGSPEAWKIMWEINVLAVAIATREALAMFDSKQGGQVINISSTSAHRVPAGGGFYAATKYALRALTEVVRQELVVRESLSRISSISPGRVATDFFGSENSREASTAAAVGNFLLPEDVATVVLQILDAPRHVVIQDVMLRPRGQHL